MHSSSPASEIVLANLSRWKCALGGIGVLTLGIIPNLPSFGDGLTYGSFYYATLPGVAIRLIATSGLICLGAILLIGVGIATVSSPKAVWFVNNEIRWGRIGTKRLALTLTKSVSFDPVLKNIRLERMDDGKPMLIPTRGLRSDDAPERLLEKLRSMVGES